LRDLDRLRTDLLANVSHELRTPLASIKGFSTMLLDYDKRLKHDKKRNYLESIDKSTDKLKELIDQLLDMSRLEAGMMALNKQYTDIEKLLQDTVVEAQVRLPTHRLSLDLIDGLPEVNIDPMRIRQVLDNIINNAVKYSPAGTEVVVAVRRVGNGLLTSVIDQGVGIPKEDHERVFERMYRSQKGQISGVRGAGLGLSICKGLVEAHDGRIWIESEEGKGTKCCFTLPINIVGGDSVEEAQR